MMWRQLIQQKVQKSRIRSLPRTSASFSGRSVLIQGRSAGKSGALTFPANDSGTLGGRSVPREAEAILFEGGAGGLHLADQLIISVRGHRDLLEGVRVQLERREKLLVGR